MATYGRRQFPRKDSAADWTSANPVLEVGEQGFETDTGKFKIGDGITAWNSLPYGVTAANLAPATTSSLGGIVVGKHMTIDGSNKLDVDRDSGRVIRSIWAVPGDTTPRRIKANNATLSLVTQIAVDGLEPDGTSRYSFLNTLRAGDHLIIQDIDTPANRARYKITTTPADLFGVWPINVEFVHSVGATPSAGANVVLETSAGGTVSAAWGDITGKPSTFAPVIATDSVVGGVKEGSGIDIAGDGTISVVSSPVTSFTSGLFVDAVADFGVVQSNAVDSRAALQAALDSIKTSGGTVYLKGNNKNPNAYSLSGPVFFNGSNQRILGAGKQSTYISTLGPAFVTGPEPYYWPSATSYVDTDTSATVACRDGSNKFIMDGRFREQITKFQTGGTYGAGGSGQPALEMSGIPGGYYGYRTRGVSKIHFPGHPLANGSKKAGFSGVAGWELQPAFTLNLIYFAHGAKVNGGLLGTGQSGEPDPWILVGDGTEFFFYLAMTNDKLYDRTQIMWRWAQPATNGLHRISIQIDLTPGAERLDVWQDRVKVTPTVQAVPANNWITTLAGNALKSPYNIISPWQHKDFTLGSDSWTIGYSMQSGSQSDYTIVGFAGFSSLMFDAAETNLTRLDAATVTDGNTALPSSTVYDNSMACLGTSTATGYDFRTFTGSLFSTWGLLMPTNGPPTACVNAVIEDLEIIGQANQNNCDGISTLPTLGLRIENVSINSGFFNSIGGFDGLVSYPLHVISCDLGSLGNHILVAGFAQAFITDCRYAYIGRRSITSSGSFTKIEGGLVNEYQVTAEGFFAAFPGRSVGAGLHVSNLLINQEGGRTIPKIAGFRIHASYYISSNDVIFDRVDIGASPAVPAILIDTAFPPGQTNPGIVELRNMHWAPSGPTLAIRGTSAKGYADVDRGGCQQEVVQIISDNSFSSFVGFRPETVSPVITRHYDFYSVPNLGGWLPKSHELTMINPPEGGVSRWGVKTGGVEGSNAPPAWEPLGFVESRNTNALSGNVLSTMHVRVSANHPDVGSPVTLWGTFINDSPANLILQRVLNGSATFDRTNFRVDYEWAQEVINSQYPGSAVTSSVAATNNSTVWPAASGGTKSNAVAIPLVDNPANTFTYDEMTRVRASFRIGIGSGSNPLTFCIGRTNYTNRKFLIDGTYDLAIGDVVVANSVRDGSWCHYIQNRVLDYVFGNGSPTIPGTFYFGLSRTPIAADGTGLTEVSGTGYARVAVTANATNFGPHDEYLSTWSNKLAIAFGTPGSDWGWCRWGFITDASSDGNILAKWPLNRPVYVRNGDDAPTYYPRAMQFQV